MVISLHLFAGGYANEQPHSSPLANFAGVFVRDVRQL